jgi:hypothetical protein
MQFFFVFFEFFSCTYQEWRMMMMTVVLHITNARALD